MSALSAYGVGKLDPNRRSSACWAPFLVRMVRIRLRRFEATDLTRVLSGLCVRLGCRVGNDRVVRKILLPACAAALDGCTRPSELADMASGLAAHPGLSSSTAARDRRGSDPDPDPDPDLDSTAARDRRGSAVVVPGEKWRKSFWERAEAVCSKCSDENEIQLMREAASKLLGGPPSSER